MYHPQNILKKSEDQELVPARQGILLEIHHQKREVIAARCRVELDDNGVSPFLSWYRPVTSPSFLIPIEKVCR